MKPSNLIHFITYKKVPLLFIVSLFVLSVFSCNQSSLTNKDLLDVSVINAEIEIWQSLEKANENGVTIELYDKDNDEIRNDTVKFFVNDIPLRYIIKQQLYYTKDYYYHEENIKPVNNKYKLEIELPNRERFFLAEIAALKTVNKKDIICNENGKLDKDFLINWANLGDVNQLIIDKSTETIDPKEPNITTYNQEPDTVNIKSNGSYMIPKSTKKTSVGILNFIANKTGSVNPKLLEGSKIEITGTLEIRMDNE